MAAEAPNYAPNYNDISGLIKHVHTDTEEFRRLEQIQTLVGHYEAAAIVPDMDVAGEIAHLLGLAHFHQYGRTFDGAGKYYGRTLEYTFAAFNSGRIYRVNDERLVTWSHKNGNFVGMSILMCLGVGQEPSEALKAVVKQHFDYQASRSDMNISRKRVWGHGETAAIYGGGPDWGNNTDCPGKALQFVKEYRMSNINPNPAPAPGPVPAPAPAPAPTIYEDGVTHHSVQHGFLDFFRQFGGDERGVAIFGRPLTEEMADSVEGWSGTVQYFERARFEWHTETQPGHVELGRVGALALDSRGTPRLGTAC